MITFAFTTPYVSASASSATILVEASTGAVLDAENCDARLPMASVTKIMTAYTVIQNASPDEIVKIDHRSVGIEGSSMYIKVGEEYTVLELLYGLMLASGNDAAAALAYYVSGSIEAFAELMNKTAKECGLTNSSFCNPSGLSQDGHYTTASDLAKLTAIALKNELFLRIVSTNKTIIKGKTLINHNRLLREIEGCVGVKTGFTKASGRCLVSAVERDGVRLICVTLNCTDDWAVHKNLYEKHFSRCKRIKLLKEKEIYNPISVVGGYSVGYYNQDIYGVVVDNNRDIAINVKIPKFIYCDKNCGDVIGAVEIMQGDVLIAKGDLKLDRKTNIKNIKKPKIGKLLQFILHLFGF